MYDNDYTDEDRDLTRLLFSHAEPSYDTSELEDYDQATEDRDYINRLFGHR